MEEQAHGETEPTEMLRRSVVSGRIHSSYLITGTGPEPAKGALAFARAIVCAEAVGDPATGAAPTGVACDGCAACRRSTPEDEPIVLDGKGKKGPYFRYVGDHPDLLWLERGAADTRITIGQVRELQAALRLGANEGGRRCAVINEAEWLNPQAQNALLRLLEEPPPQTSLVLVSVRASAIIATIRSRSVRVRFPVETSGDLRSPDASEATQRWVGMLDRIGQASVADLLDEAENYRGARAVAAEGVTELIDLAAAWLNESVKDSVLRGERPTVRKLDAYRSLQQLRRDLLQRNANPQMVAERLLLGLRDSVNA